MLRNGLILLLAAGLTASLVLHWRWHRDFFGPTSAGHALPAEAVDPVAARFDAVFDHAAAQPGLAGAAIGFCLIDGSGAVIHEREARTAQIPASTLKTLTTSTALEVLGADFRFETALGFSAPVGRDGILDGDLIILGGADPMLSIADLRAWAADLVRTGVKSVTGRVIGDGRYLAGSLYPDFWNWGDIGNGFGSPVSGLNLEHNRFVARFLPGTAAGEAAEVVDLAPEVPGVVWWNLATTGPADSGDGIMIHGGERAGVIHLRGTVPLEGGELEVTGAVPDPERFAAHHLRLALGEAGITVLGEAAGAAGLVLEGLPVPEAVELPIRHLSAPLIDLITSIHATSDNLETECLYRLLGLHGGQPPDAVVRAHWTGRGLAFQGLRMVDGCGLARADHITPHDLARLQHLAASGPEGEKYLASLLATEDGTLRWKAGAMSAVRSYTGCITRADGTRHSFALMVNHFTDPAAVNALRDAVVAAMREE